MPDTITAPVEVRPVAPIESDQDFEQMMNPFEDPSDADPNHKAHYVSMRDNPEFEKRFGNMNASGMINTARLFHVEIRGMCGHTWIPKLNPKAFPVCEVCAEIAFNRLTN